MNGRRIAVGFAGAVCLALSSWSAFGLALAKSDRPRTTKRFDPSLVQIVSPEPGSPVFESGTRVVLKVRAGTHVRVRIGRRNVTARFHPAGRGLLAGTVRLADSGRGPTELHVDSTRGAVHDKDFLLLIGAHQDRRFLSVRLHRTGTGAAPIDLTIHTAAMRVFLRVRLNGHRLERLMVPGRIGSRSLRLTALHGLRYGRNTLTVLAHDGRGTGDQVTKRFTIKRTGPMPAANYRTIAHVTGTEVLDAGISRAAHGGRLLYRWRLLGRARGSHAVIRGRTSRKARFRIDRAGRYRVRLTVIELPKRRRRRGAKAAVAGHSSHDDFTVSAQPVISPYGWPVTMGSKPGIEVGTNTYTLPPEQFGAIQVLVIDRATGAVLNQNDQEIPAAGGYRDINTLASDMANQQGPFSADVGTGQIVMIEAGWWAPQQPPPPSSTVVTELQSELSQYGVDDPVSDANALIQGAGFAMVAVKGMDAGQAVVDPDGLQGGKAVLDQASDGESLDGVLRIGPDGLLRFEQIDLVPYTTNNPTQPANLGPYGGNIVSTAATPQGDMSLTVLDAHTLALLATVTVPSGSAPSPGPLAPLLSMLNAYVPEPCVIDTTKEGGYTTSCTATSPNNAVLFVLRANGYQPNSDGLDTMTLHAVVQDLAEVGVDRDTLIRSFAFPQATPALAGSDYVFIGGPGMHGIEGSALKTITNQAGQQVPVSSATNLHGFLVRDEHGRLTPAGGTDSAAFDPTLERMAATPPVQFAYPGSDVAAYQAAEDHLFEQYFAQSVLKGFPEGFRVNYGNTGFTDELPAILTQLHCQTTVGQPPSHLNGEYKPTTQYTFNQLDQMRRMLCDEMLRQETVDTNLFGPLRAIFLQEKVDGTLDLLGADSTLAGYVQESDPVPGGVDPLEIAGSVATLLSGLAEDLVPEVGEEVGSFLSLAGDTMTVAAGFSRQDTTSIEYNHMVGEINVEAGQLAAWVENRFNDAQDAVNEIEGVVLSNPNSLVTAYNRAIGANGVWNLGTANNPILKRTGPITFESQLSSLNYMYPHLVAAAAQTSCSRDQAWNTSPAGSMKYRAAIDSASQPGPVAEPFTAVISSLGFSPSAADALDPTLFNDGGQGYVQGTPPPAASIVRTDFFMLQIAPNNTTCSEGNSDPFCCSAAALGGGVGNANVADRPRGRRRPASRGRTPDPQAAR